MNKTNCHIEYKASERNNQLMPEQNSENLLLSRQKRLFSLAYLTENGSGYTMKKLPRHQPAAEMQKPLILQLRGKNTTDMENRSSDEERTIENWLLTETNLSRAELRITALDPEEAAETTDGA